MGQTLGNIYNNVNFALNLQTEAMARLQEQASTGARINRVSDGPSDAYQILGLNSQERSLENYMDNLLQVVDHLEISATVIQNMLSGLTSAKTSLTQIVNGIYGEDSRKRVAEGINDILEQGVLLANTNHNNQYLFGGSDSASIPYLVERTNGEITRVTYQGSLEGRNAEIAPAVEVDVSYVGDNIFRSDDRSGPIFPGNTGAEAGTGTSSV
ncbi:MAG: flagellar hook-associated protein FlgL, partial [Planctomycetota bacterium]